MTARLSSQQLTEHEIQTIREFAAGLRADLDTIGNDYVGRRRVLEALRVEGTLGMQDGERVVFVKCILGDTTEPMGRLTTSLARTAGP